MKPSFLPAPQNTPTNRKARREMAAHLRRTRKKKGLFGKVHIRKQEAPELRPTPATELLCGVGNDRIVITGDDADADPTPG